MSTTPTSTPVTALVCRQPTVAAEHLVGAMRNDRRFDVVAAVQDVDEAVEWLKRSDTVPQLVILCLGSRGARPPSSLPQLLRRVPSVIAVSLMDGQDESVFLDAGVMHFEKLATSPLVPLIERRLERTLRTIYLLSDVLAFRGRPPSSSGWMAINRRTLDSRYTKDLTHRASTTGRYDIVGVGCSTGGLQAMEQLLSDLPPNLRVPIVIVQHIGAGDDEDFVHLLERRTILPIEVVSERMIPLPGHIYVASSRGHLIVEADHSLNRIDDLSTARYNPSVDVFFSSLSQVHGSRSIGVLLTGMGSDGAAGLLEIKDSGGQTIVQDKESSVVFGMPAAAIDLGAAQKILPMASIGKALSDLTKPVDTRTGA